MTPATQRFGQKGKQTKEKNDMSETAFTLRELFEVDPKELAARVEGGLDVHRAAADARQEIAKEASSIRWPWVRDAVAEQSRDLLDLNVIDVMMACWKKYMEIARYADRKKYGPEEEILVPLVAHTVKSQHHPYIQILLKEREVGRVTFDLDFSLILEGFVLKIRDARIVEILTGSGKGEGALSLAEVSIWKRELKPVSFPGRLSLGQGIPLRDDRGTTAE
jgi:hypothetical protein